MIQATNHFAGSGPVTSPSALSGSDPTGGLQSYTPTSAARLSVPLGSKYTRRGATKEEKAKEGASYTKLLSTTNTGGPGGNHVVLNTHKLAFWKVKERQDGQVSPGGHALSEEGKKATLAGGAEASWTSAAARYENSHPSAAGTTAVNLSAEGPSFKLAAEGEARYDLTPGKQWSKV